MYQLYILKVNKAVLSFCFLYVQPNLGLAAEHGFFTRPPGAGRHWYTLNPLVDHSWKAMALPILKQYQESTDGSYIEVKHSALVWHYRNADPDLGNWQVRWGLGLRWGLGF
jgi:trehalose 6-phosphate synthase/phosphatase